MLSVNRRLLLIRHGERVDNLFGKLDWLSQVVDEGTEPKQKTVNVNIPSVLPKRPDGRDGWLTDSPLTEVGAIQAGIVGKELVKKGFVPQYIFVSPAYRCQETAWNILGSMTMAACKEAMPNRINFCVEPGLFEWGGFHNVPRQPRFLHPKEGQHPSVKVVKDYVPCVNQDNLNMEETLAEYHIRSHRVIDHVLKFSAGSEFVMVVAHGPTFPAVTRYLQKKADLDGRKFSEGCNSMPYLGFVSLSKERNSDGPWTLHESTIPAFDHTGNPSYDWKEVARNANAAKQ